MIHAPVAIVVVNWNGWRHTLACLARLEQCRAVPWHVYLVDNASSDDSLAHLTELGSDVELIRSGTNEGWSGGNNIGVRRALANGHEFIYLLNNDALVRDDTIERLVAAHRSVGGRAPVLGSLQRSDDDSEYSFVSASTDRVLGIPIWLEAHQYADAVKVPMIPSAFAGGAALFAHRSIYEEIGLFDERFFLNYDETDWCFRAAKAGHPIFIVRESVVLHTGSATIGGHHSPLQNYFLARNRLLFAEKHGTGLQRLHNLRKCLGLMKWLSTSDSAAGRVRKILRPGPVMRGVQLGVRDYFLRRFGDCPPEIRQLNRGHVMNDGAAHATSA